MQLTIRGYIDKCNRLNNAFQPAAAVTSAHDEFEMGEISLAIIDEDALEDEPSDEQACDMVQSRDASAVFEE